MNCEEMPDTLGFMIVYTGKMILKDINSDFVTLNAEITFEQMGVLYYISKNHEKKMIQQDIAQLMNKTKSAVLRIIDILEKKMFLNRVAMLNDRRKNVIQLTEKGWKIIEKMHEKFLELDKGLITEITKCERENCISALLKIQAKCG